MRECFQINKSVAFLLLQGCQPRCHIHQVFIMSQRRRIMLLPSRPRLLPGSYRYFIVIFGAAVPGSLDKKGVRRCHLLLNKDGRCLTNSARSWVADAHFKMRGFTVPMEYRYTLQHSSVGLNGILWTQQHWFKSIARIILSHGNLC
jgi:hypothetical protein